MKSMVYQIADRTREAKLNCLEICGEATNLSACLPIEPSVHAIARGKNAARLPCHSYKQFRPLHYQWWCP